MKRICDGCRASSYDRPTFICELGYKIDATKGKPLEECPKPKTIQKMIDLIKLKNKYNLTIEELAKWKFH